MNLLKEFLSQELEISKIPLPKGDISLSVLRLDKIHPVVSGNKIFKLYFFLKEALQSPESELITFGGAYSNHLVATAYAATKLGIPATGFVRGEEPTSVSHTLRFCSEQGMDLHFLSRALYRKYSTGNIPDSYFKSSKSSIIIPEGGFSINGAEGAALLHKMVDLHPFTHICLATGTATTLSGILRHTHQSQEVLAFPALKGMTDTRQRLTELKTPTNTSWKVFSEYHFGGYAKMKPELLNFMNRFYGDYGILLDRVYTAKMMYGVFNLIEKYYFPKGSNILCLHTGGLQGNTSLPAGSLIY